MLCQRKVTNMKIHVHYQHTNTFTQSPSLVSVLHIAHDQWRGGGEPEEGPGGHPPNPEIKLGWWGTEDQKLAA